MTEAWLCAVLAGRMARLRALVPRDDLAAIGRHLDDVVHLSQVGGLGQLDEAVRHARDLGSGGRPIAMVIDAISRAVPPMPTDAVHLIPVQAVLVNLAAIGRAEGAAVEVEAIPLVLPGTMMQRIAVAMSDLIGDALDHGCKAIAIGVKLDGARIVAEVRAADGSSVGSLSLPRP